MVRKRKVVWTETATAELKDTFAYWNKRNASTVYSKRLRKLVTSAIQKLVLFPKSGVPTQFDNIRFIVVKDYLIFYQEWQENIVIISFWDGRQEPEKLKNRLK
jgi:addiction module RelE/StbE family toxin